MTYKSLAACTECSLQGSPWVPGSGSSSPRVVFVGEAPGYYEVKAQQPFVGRVSKLLHKCLEEAGLKKEDCYFTNTCLCQPEENRKLSALEIKSCRKRLEQEIKDKAPEYIVTLGATACKNLLPGSKLELVRGKPTDSPLGKVIPMYHPAAALYPKGEGIFLTFARDLLKLSRRLTGKILNTQEHTEVKIITTDEEFYKAVNAIRLQHTIAYDWETTGLNSEKHQGICLGMSWKEGTAVVFTEPYISKKSYIKVLRDALNRTDLRLTAFNAPFDIQWNRKIGLPDKLEEDVMLEHYMLDERPQQRNLEGLACDYCDAPAYETELLMRYKCSKSEMKEKIPLKEICTYCGKDCDYTLRLHNIFRDELLKIPRLYKVYSLLLIPGAHVFVDIQNKGIWIDQDSHKKASKEFKERTTTVRKELADIVGDVKFNPNSPQQVQKVVWDTLGLQEPDLYGRKARSVDKDTRKALLDEYPNLPFIVKLHEFKEVYTLWSRYLRDLPEWIDEDGRIRTKYFFDRTETGRLSTKDPALHTIPQNKSIRAIFAAPPGNVLIQADYAQIEMRMAAHIAKDFRLAKILEAEDFHRKMAAEVFNVAYEEVTKNQRQAAKMVSFGLLYLMGDKKLADNTGLSTKEALQFVKEYKSLMPHVMQWIAHTKAKVRSQRYVESPFGRRRRFHLITQHNLSGLQREAVNMPIQSGASDLTLWQVIKLHRFFKEKIPEAHVVLMVHDSIIVECAQSAAKEVATIMKIEMEKPPFSTQVKFPVDITIGKAWGQGDDFTI